MKIKSIILFLICIALFAALTACYDGGVPNGEGLEDNTDISEPSEEGGNSAGGGDTTEGGKEIITLVTNGVANFRFVTTSEIGSNAVRGVDALIVRLRELGVELDDRVSDMKSSDVSDCEIIVGTGARGRTDECNVSQRELGQRGYIIKAVGKRIVIAGGTSEKTNEALGIFAKEYLGITDGREERISSLTVPQELLCYVPTEYKVTSVAIGDNDLSKYSIFIDTTRRATDYQISVSDIQNGLYNSTGYWLDVGNTENMDSCEYRIILKYVDDAGENGLRIFVDGSDLIVESAYVNALTESFEKFLKKNVFDLGYDVIIPIDTYYTEHVSTVHYKDFGAVGDGYADDYDALYRAHQYANIGGQKVYADEGATYYVNVFTKPIPVMTDVDFTGAKFIIDDRGSDVFAGRSLALFSVIRDKGPITLSVSEIEELSEQYDISITYNTTELPWLVPYISSDSLVMFYNSDHKDYIRYGANEDNGYTRQDVMFVTRDGKISADTPPAYEFDHYTSVCVYSTDDKPITICGGYFETICCRTVKETDYINKWLGYSRGININRSNVTVKDLEHTVTGEPVPSPYNYEGDRKESYPYYGFIYVLHSYGVTVENCKLVGRTVYYQDKPATSSSAARPVDMGSYDFVIEHSSHVTFKNVIQTNSITDNTYWGIMSSNGAKNMTFDGCYISRFDAHRGFFNAEVTNTTIGRVFNVIGGGHLNVSNTVRLAGNSFITLRGDYGATFRGDITLVGCTLETYYEHTGGELSTSARNNSYAYVINSGYSSGSELYLNWDFGYTCYMPINVTLDGFSRGGSGNLYLYNNISDAAFSSDYSNAYRITESITYRNMTRLTTCNSSACTKLRAIPVTVE